MSAEPLAAWYAEPHVQLWQGDCRAVMAQMPADSVDCVVFSPPFFGLRKYDGVQELVWGAKNGCEHKWQSETFQRRSSDSNPGAKQGTNAGSVGRDEPIGHATCAFCHAWRGAWGLEPSVELWVSHTVEVMQAVRRVLKPSGVCWVEVGDSYAGSGSPGGDFRNGKGGDDYLRPYEHGGLGLKPKDLCLVPERLALALQADGWWVRSRIVWAKENPMPESIHGSYFTRHRVTIEEYERLQSLRIAEGDNQNGASNMPGMSTGEISPCEKAVSAEREGESYGSETGRTSRSPGGSAVIQPLPTRQGEQDEIRSDSERQSNQAESDSQIQRIGKREGKSKASEQSKKVQSSMGREEEVSGQTLSGDRERESCPCQGNCQTEIPIEKRGLLNDFGRLARHSPKQPLSLFLLQEEAKADIRPCNTFKQGREAHEGEHSASLCELQFEKARQANSALVDCPGCPKCQHGLIHINGSGRPTKSHSTIWMLTKAADYFWDGEAVREPHSRDWGSESSHGSLNPGSKYTIEAAMPTAHPRHNSPPQMNPSGRNVRDVWTFPTSPFGYELCQSCGQIYTAAQFGRLPQAKHLPEVHQEGYEWHFRGPSYLEGRSTEEVSPVGVSKLCRCGASDFLSHFATFGEAIPARCILASTSEAGCCPKCGKPWERIIERTGHINKREPAHVPNHSDTKVDSTGWAPMTKATNAWRPDCSCDLPQAENVPATVLDVCSGSGTTVLAAKKLGRRAIGIDLSEKYLALAHRRLSEVPMSLKGG